MIAHSMGATAAAYALRAGVRPARLVLLAPLADPLALLRAFADGLNMGPRVRAGLERAVQQRVGAPFEAFGLPAMAATIDLPPTLVVHDRGDREVAFADARSIADAWPDARLVATEGLGHRRLLRDSAVLTHVVDFVGPAADEADSIGPAAHEVVGSIRPAAHEIDSIGPAADDRRSA